MSRARQFMACLVALLATLLTASPGAADDVSSAVLVETERLSVSTPTVVTPLRVVLIGFGGDTAGNLTIPPTLLRAYLDSLVFSTAIETVLPNADASRADPTAGAVRDSRVLPLERRFEYQVEAAPAAVAAELADALATAIATVAERTPQDPVVVPFSSVDMTIRSRPELHTVDGTDDAPTLFLLNPGLPAARYVYGSSSDTDGSDCPAAWFESGSGTRYVWADVRAGAHRRPSPPRRPAPVLLSHSILVPCAGPVLFGSSASGIGQRQAFFDMLQRQLAAPKAGHHLVTAQLANFVHAAATHLLQPPMLCLQGIQPPETVVVVVRPPRPRGRHAATIRRAAARLYGHPAASESLKQWGMERRS